LKVCRRCRVEKQSSLFPPEPRNKDGISSYCIACQRRRAAIYRPKKAAGIPTPKRVYTIKPVVEKTCTQCRETKPISEFNRCSAKARYKDGYLSCCRECRRLANNARKLELRSDPAWVEKNKWRRKSHRLRGNYGIDIHEFNRMLANQQERCGLCDKPFTNDQPPRVDHCHTTGRIRGLLHPNCNAFIGLANEDIHKLEMAIHYLRLHKFQVEEDANATRAS
jgi:hypothetical protein